MVQLSSFLERYRASKHATTRESPFKLMFGREMRIRFDQLKANSARRYVEKAKEHNSTKKDIEFSINETVYARDYRDPKKPMWIRAKVVARLGSVLYRCDSEELGIIKRRSHQLLKYPYDDLGEESDREMADAVLPNAAESIGDSEDFAGFPEGEEDEARIGRRLSDGTYVTRYNRVVRRPRHLERE